MILIGYNLIINKQSKLLKRELKPPLVPKSEKVINAQ